MLVFARVRLLRFGESAAARETLDGSGIAVIDGHDVGGEDAGEVVAHERLENDDGRADDADVNLDAGPDCGAPLGVGDVGIIRKGHDVGDTNDTDDHHTVRTCVSGLRRAFPGG